MDQFGSTLDVVSECFRNCWRNVRTCFIQKQSIQAASAISGTLRCWPDNRYNRAACNANMANSNRGVDLLTMLTSGKSCTRCQEPAKKQHPILGSREAFSHLVSLSRWFYQSILWRTLEPAFMWVSDWLESKDMLLSFGESAQKMQSSNCNQMYSLLCVWTES